MITKYKNEATGTEIEVEYFKDKRSMIAIHTLAVAAVKYRNNQQPSAGSLLCPIRLAVAAVKYRNNQTERYEFGIREHTGLNSDNGGPRWVYTVYKVGFVRKYGECSTTFLEALPSLWEALGRIAEALAEEERSEES